MLNFTSYKAEKKVEKNKVILSSERKHPYLYILHQGRVSLNYPLEDGTSFSFYEFTTPQYFGYESFFKNKFFVEFKTLEDSVISFIPINSFQEIMKVNFKLVPSLLVDLFKKSKRYSVLMHEVISKIATFNNHIKVLALLLKNYNIKWEIDDEVVKDYSIEVDSPLLDFNDYLEIAEGLENNKYRYFNHKPSFILENLFTEDVVGHFYKIIEKKPKIAKNLFEEEVEELFYFHNFAYQSYKKLFREIDILALNKNSLLKAFQKNQTNIPASQSNFFLKTVEFFQNLILTERIFKDAIPISDIEKNFSFDLTPQSAETSEKNESENKTEEEEINSPTAEEESRETNDIISIFIKNKNSPEIPQEDIKKVKNYNKNYLLYTKETFLKHKDSLENNSDEEFIRYGIYDNLLTDQHKKITTQYIDADLAHNTENTEVSDEDNFKKPQVLYFFEWIKKIAEGLEEPSNSDLGISYKKHLINQSKIYKKDKKKVEPIEDKITYEIDNMFSSIMYSFNPNAFSLFPLNKISFPPDPHRSVLNKKKVLDLLDEIVEKDFTAFYREAIFKYKNQNHILQLEIMPYFIILPTISSRIIFWQEMTEYSKRSRARFFVPLYYVGQDIKKDLIIAIAFFRWELCRTIKGINWVDPVEGGITGGINDYISFYKKNHSLTTEHKERIANLIKKHRNVTKKVFADMYYSWLNYESNGVVRLNDTEREIFSKYAPFKKPIRDKLIKLPLFERHITRYQNVSHKEAEVIERRFRKYKKEGSEDYIDEIQDHLNFYTL